MSEDGQNRLIARASCELPSRNFKKHHDIPNRKSQIANHKKYCSLGERFIFYSCEAYLNDHGFRNMLGLQRIFPAFLLLQTMCEVNGFLHTRQVSYQQPRTFSIAAGDIIELDDSNYRKLFAGDKPLLVDACAPWCGPCKLIEPVVERCAENFQNSLVVSRYDVESKNNDVKMELLLQGVMPNSLPSLILIHKNKAITTHNGVVTDEQLEEFIQEQLEGLQNVNAVTESTTVEDVEEASSVKKAGFINFASQKDDYMVSGYDM